MYNIYSVCVCMFSDQGAQTVIVEARQGDQVFVRVVDNQNLSLGGELYSSFSGYLLAPMDRQQLPLTATSSHGPPTAPIDRQQLPWTANSSP